MSEFEKWWEKYTDYTSDDYLESSHMDTGCDVWDRQQEKIDGLEKRLGEAEDLLTSYNKMVKDEFLKPKGYGGKTDIDDYLETYKVGEK